MSSIKLTYFNAMGRAETARLLFALGSVPFVDERLTKDEYSARKPSLPSGQLPVLEVDGKVFPQSKAITRYAAVRAGVYPADPVHAMVNEVTVEHITDVAGLVVPIMHCPDTATQAALMAAFFDTKLPPILLRIEAIVSENSGSYVTGRTTSYADVCLFSLFETLLAFNAEVLAPFPCLTALNARVAAIPQIAAHVAARALRSAGE